MEKRLYSQLWQRLCMALHTPLMLRGGTAFSLSTPGRLKSRLVQLIFIGCLLAILPSEANATVFDANTHITFSYDPCAGKIRVKILVGDSDGCDDALMAINLFRRNADGSETEFFRGVTDDAFAGHDTWLNHTDDSDDKFYYSGSSWNGQSLGNFQRTTSGELIYLEFDWYSLPQQQMDLGSISVRIDYSWAQDFNGACTQDNSQGSPTRQVDVTAGAPLAPTGLVASSSTCGSVSLTWDAIAATTCTGYSISYDVYRGSVRVGTVTSTSYTDNIAAGSYSYSVVAKKLFTASGTPYHKGASSSTEQGTSAGVPANTFSLVASDDLCARSVIVNWSATPLSTHTGFSLQRSSTLSPFNPTFSTTISGSARQYNDQTITRGVPYYYKVLATNHCGSSPASDVEPGKALSVPAAASNVSATADAVNGRVSITWVDNSTNEASFVLERSFAGGGGLTAFNVDSNVVNYVDNTVTSCVNYSYIVKAVNECVATNPVPNSGSAGTAYLPTNITDVFDGTTYKLVVSKGYYSNRVQLNWTANKTNLLDAFKIYRRQVGTPSFIQIAAVSNSQTSYADLTADANVLYEYKIEGEKDCAGLVTTSNSSADVGMKSPSGIITGQITYTGGIAVPDVRVLAQNVLGGQGSSLAFDGTLNYAEVPHSSTLLANGDFGVETWVRPNNISGSAVLMSKSGATSGYTLSANNGNVTFGVWIGGSLRQVSYPGALSAGAYTHLSGVLSSGKLKLYVNGIPRDSLSVSGAVDANTDNVVIGRNTTGDYFSGNMDDIRFWRISRTDADVRRDFNRVLSGTEPGLLGYWKLDENIGILTRFFDISKTGNLFNENHGSMYGASWSTTIPSSAQLGYAGVTDATGSYIISGIRYNGTGENFQVVPSLGVHVFSPAVRTMFVGDGSSALNNIDFLDQSSFRVLGRATYYGCNCYVDDATVMVDGRPVNLSNGQAAKTGSTGEFDIQVPIGLHRVSLYKQGHTFSEGVFPPTGLHDFQQPILTHIRFVDSTLVSVVGRVVGGWKEGDKVPALGRSKNNIGQSGIRFVSPLGCKDTVVQTNVVTGEYKVSLPPVRYEINQVTVVNNPTLAASLLPTAQVIDLRPFIDLNTVRDSIKNTQGALIRVDSAKYHHLKNFVHNSSPDIAMYDSTGRMPFIGERQTKITKTTTLQLAAMSFPVFQNGNLYKAKIYAYEVYSKNPGLPSEVRDTIPVKVGEFRIDNRLSYNPAAVLSFNQSMGGMVNYQFAGGEPNLALNGNVPEYSFTKTLQMNLVTPNHTKTYEPYATPSAPGPSADRLYRGYVFGAKHRGTDFTTGGPSIVDLVLRRPPGDRSYTKWSRGTSIAKRTYNYSDNQLDISARPGITFGFQAGSTATVGAEVHQEVGLYFNSNMVWGQDNTVVETTTATQDLQTPYEDEGYGDQGDLYVGKARQIIYGVTDDIKLVKADACNLGMAVCSPISITIGADTYYVGKMMGMAVTYDNNNVANFAYTRFHIETNIIPALALMRNRLFTTQANAYQTTLTVNHPMFGSNNDDPGWGPDVSTTTPYQTERNLAGQRTSTGKHDFRGRSYTYNNFAVPADSTKVDSIRWYNQQIRLWKVAIRSNEKEKIRAKSGLYGPPTEVLNFGGAIGIGRSYTQARENEESKTYEFDMDAGVWGSLNAGTGTWGATVGFKLDFELGYGRNVKSETNNTTATETTFEYHFEDKNLGDALSVSVFPSKNTSWSHVFVTNGGRTSCPYDAGAMSRYVSTNNVGLADTICTSHTDFANSGIAMEMSARTSQREKPEISITPSILYNVPSDQAAVFTVDVANLSETVEGIEYNVFLDESSNPNSCRPLGVFNGVYDVPGGTSLSRQLSILRGPTSFEYDSVRMIVHSVCQWRTEQGVDIADTAYFSIRYLPTCTPPSVVSPLDNWVLNSNFNDTLPVTIAGYDYNYFGLDKVKFQYRDAASPIWTDVETFYKNTTSAPPGAVSPQAIPSNLAYIYKPFDMKQIADGNYQIRAVTECNFPGHAGVQREGDILNGVADRVNPHPFGTPSPGDGILSPNDDISIQFNETINAGILNFTNVDIRGVVNGTNVAHSTALAFDGAGDYAELAPGLSLVNRDFTFECWHRRDGLGEQTIISQGIDAAQTLRIGFDASDKFVLGIGTSQVVADNAQTDVTSWHHYAVVFDNTTKVAQLFVDGTLANLGSQSLPKTYTGSGRTYFGKSSTGTPRWLNGPMHEVRIWNKKRLQTQLIANMSILLSGTESGIVGNWRMDEAIGGFAKDKIRSRQAQIFNATWKVYPSGSSLAFGTNANVAIPSSTLSISKEMDFTLEMWVKGNTTGAAQTLWSNGKADGTDGSPTFKWRIDADAAGAIKLYNNTLTFDAIPSNVLDGTWHHIAFVLRRSSSISAYLDGGLISTTPAAAWGEIGNNKMWLGARRYMVSTAEQQDQPFTGNIDEFRFWNSSRQQEQIERDMVNRLNGDETGLLSYLPFEDYRAVMGVPILTPTIYDAALSTRTITATAATLSPLTPTIKLPRPVQTIPYQRSVNNDRMILTPTVDPALIENVTLDITVRGVRDLHGNVMQSPKTWIAYMDKNQVKWQDQELSYTKAINTQLTFNAVIVNTGGALKQYTIQNLPSWLSVSSPSGIISPASSHTVTFTVDQGLNIGDYEQDVQLLTDFGYAEVLVVKMKVFAPAPSTWTVNPSAFQSSMSMIGALQVDNVLSSNTEDRLAAFVNGQCRGVGRLQYYPQYDRYLIFLDVYSNVSSGEQLTFQMWDASKGQIYADVQPHIDFFADSLVGQILNPQIFNATSKVIVTRTLNNGWNWLSFPAMPTDSVNIANLLRTLTFNNNDEFKSNTLFSRYARATGWVGSLSRVDVEPSYRLKASRGGVLTYEARELDPSTKPISLAAGWNWMGFVSLRNQAVGDALGNHNPTAGDLIKGQTQFAVYDPILGWIGSLEYLRPSEGYMMRSAAAGTFTFPLAGSSNRNPTDAEIVDARWPYNPGDWNTNASMLAELDYCGSAVPEGAYYIGVFQGNQCRGLAEPILFSNRQRSLAFLTLYGNSNDSLELRLLDRVSGAETPISSRISYIPNGQLGDLTTPYTLQLPSGFACQGISGVEDVENSLIGARPVPFADDLTVTWPEELAPASEEVTIRLTDMQGKLIMEVRANGGTKFLGQLSQLPNGMYILTVQGDTQTAQLKVVKARP